MTEITKNKKFDALLDEIKQISGLIWESGWAEANAGNFSVNATEIFKGGKYSFSGKRVKTSGEYKFLRNNFIVISRAGSRMRDISINPISDICILYIDKTGKGYYSISTGGEKDIKPTSELLTHLEIQNKLVKNNPEEKAVLHTHPAELIALTNLKKFTSGKNINKLFYSVLPELSVLFPDGIGFVKCFDAGSEELALQTGRKFRKKKIVLWEKHGCVSAGRNLSEAFDRIDVMVKSAKIFFLAASTGNKTNGLNVHQIKELKNHSK
ncbi:MAG: rhamnulose-1-phosphate aldolase [Ignavibacteriae bacterium]|nr:rhamnulose-1-phosphate aldolase [Ignavibacteriota bacterium]